jgi:hypothetical protein
VNHVFQIDNRPGLQLQIEEQLNILGFQEIIFDDKFEEIFRVGQHNAFGLDAFPEGANLLVVFVKGTLHAESFLQVSLSGLV